MRLSSLSLLLFLGTAAHAQVPFERILTMPGALYIAGAAIDTEGHFVIASVNEGDIQVSRISPEGDHEWTNTYPLFTEDGLYGNGVAVGPDGILVAGYTMGLGTNSRDGLLLRIGLDGTLTSAQRVDAGSSNAFHYVKATNDGFIVTGRSDAGGNQYDMLLAKLDTEGAIQWMRTYGTSQWDWAYQATPLADGGYALVGYGDGLGTGFSPSGYLVRTDASGNELWARSISSGGGVDEAYSVIESSTGDLYVGGRSLGYIPGDVSAFITKISSTGTHVWTRVLERGIETVAMVPTADGGVTWLAHPQYIPGGAGDYEMAWGTFSASGTLLNAKMHGGAGSDNGIALVDMSGGALAILGFTNTGTTDWSGTLIMTDAEGNASCGVIDLELTWTSAVATVAPFTSITGSGFDAFPYDLGTVPVTVSSHDPCCAVSAAFNSSSVDGTWTFANTSTGASSYAWDLGDGTTSTEASPSHTYATNGTYTVCLTATAACGDATTCQTISVGVGLEEQAADLGLSLYPSPAAERFTVHSERSLIASVQVIDSDGRLVQAFNGVARARVEVPTEALPSGVYALRVVLDNGAVQHMRAVVAH